MFEGWRKTATKVEKVEAESTDPNALTAEELALIDRVLAEAPVVVPAADVAMGEKLDEPKHVARTDQELVAAAEVGMNPHGFTPVETVKAVIEEAGEEPEDLAKAA